VSALKAEMAMGKCDGQRKLANRMPVVPERMPAGTNTATSTSEVAMRRCNLGGGGCRCFVGVVFASAMWPLNVFNDHDSVVDDSRWRCDPRTTVAY